MAKQNFSLVYTDMADNLTKVQFDVNVRESYVPITHYCFLGEGAPPPIRQIINEEKSKKLGIPMTSDDLCKARLSISYIIDALVNGHYLEFVHPEDMTVVKDWIRLYLDQYKDYDLSKFPDRLAFNKNAEEALNILNGNLKRMEEWEAEKNPRKLSITDLLSVM